MRLPLSILSPTDHHRWWHPVRCGRVETCFRYGGQSSAAFSRASLSVYASPLFYASLIPFFVAAASANESANFASLRVYGLLTDVSDFQFYSYDPKTQAFYSDEEILVNLKRDDFCTEMAAGDVLFDLTVLMPSLLI